MGCCAFVVKGHCSIAKGFSLTNEISMHLKNDHKSHFTTSLSMAGPFYYLQQLIINPS